MDNLLYIAGRFKQLYRISPISWLLIAAGFLILWTALMLLVYKKIPMKRDETKGLLRGPCVRGNAVFVLNLILMLLGLAIILLVTFVRRRVSDHQAILIPLRVLFGHKVPKDYWQVSIMNIVLYVPFACGMVFCLRFGSTRTLSHPAGTTILLCLFLSFIAETNQYLRVAGLAEVDDVLMNTLGGAIGTIPYAITSRIFARSSHEIADCPARMEQP